MGSRSVDKPSQRLLVIITLEPESWSQESAEVLDDVIYEGQFLPSESVSPSVCRVSDLVSSLPAPVGSRNTADSGRGRRIRGITY